MFPCAHMARASLARLRPSLLAFLVFAAPGVADGAGAPAPVDPATAQAPAHPLWACWYAAEDLMVRCVLATPAAELTGLAPVADPTRPRRRPLPPIARVIWDEPGRLTTKVVAIPLLGPPIEMDFVRELAEAVMCGPRRDCGITFDANPDGRGAERARAPAGPHQQRVGWTAAP